MTVDHSLTDQFAAGNATIDKYNRRLLWLAGITAALLIGLLVWTMVQVAGIAEDARSSAREAERQSVAIRELVERQAVNDADRQRIIDEAVGRIAAEQYRALVAHDNRIEALLQRTLGLVNQEVNGPRNQEMRAVAPLLPPALAPNSPPVRTATPKAGPPTGVAPAPAPAPAPPPCEKAGRSDRCKK